MIGAGRPIRVWAYPAPVDLRRGFDGLHGLVRQYLRRDPLGGELFLFTSRNRHTAKVLYWDGTGLCILHKRLERGCFARLWPATGSSRSTRSTTTASPAEAGVALTAKELALFLEGSALEKRVPLSRSAQHIDEKSRVGVVR